VDTSGWSPVPASWGPSGEWPSPPPIPEEDWGVVEVDDVLPPLVEYDSPEEGGFPSLRGMSPFCYCSYFVGSDLSP